MPLHFLTVIIYYNDICESVYQFASLSIYLSTFLFSLLLPLTRPDRFGASVWDHIFVPSQEEIAKAESERSVQAQESTSTRDARLESDFSIIVTDILGYFWRILEERVAT